MTVVLLVKLLVLFTISVACSVGFQTGVPISSRLAVPFGKGSCLSSSNQKSGDEDAESEAERLRRQADALREQIRKMETELGDQRKRSSFNKDLDASSSKKNSFDDNNVALNVDESTRNSADAATLRNKQILVVGANGRLGSMVCRYLLRNHPQTKVVAAVHTISEDSPTSRGYGRLSFEVGAEDGRGSIGTAWSSTDRVATFEYDEAVMGGYNLQNLRLVECELLDPVQCTTIAEGCDAVIWCATDFNGNQPRAISGLNVAFLYRALASPTKGRVEVEGVENMLRALKNAKNERKWKSGVTDSPSDPINFVLVSTAPDAFGDFETPFGSFYGIKQQGEKIVKEDFPSISFTILQMSRFEDFLMRENMEIMMDDGESLTSSDEDNSKRRITRRDAARAAADALLNKGLAGKTVQVWTGTQ